MKTRVLRVDLYKQATNSLIEPKPVNFDSVTPHLLPGGLLIVATHKETNKQPNILTVNQRLLALLQSRPINIERGAALEQLIFDN